MKILFVCYSGKKDGRSDIAKELAIEMGYEARNIGLEGVISKKLKIWNLKKQVRWADVIFFMETNMEDRMIQAGPKLENKKIIILDSPNRIGNMHMSHKELKVKIIEAVEKKLKDEVPL